MNQLNQAVVILTKTLIDLQIRSAKLQLKIARMKPRVLNLNCEFPLTPHHIYMMNKRLFIVQKTIIVVERQIAKAQVARSSTEKTINVASVRETFESYRKVERLKANRELINLQLACISNTPENRA